MQLLTKTLFFLLIDGLFASPFIGLPEKNSQPADFEDFDACKSRNWACIQLESAFLKNKESWTVKIKLVVRTEVGKFLKTVMKSFQPKR